MSNVIAIGLSAKYQKELFNGIYPVGTIYENKTNSANPSTYLLGASGSTWTSLAGRVIIGVGTVVDSRGVSTTFTANQTGGETAHLQTTSELADHTHEYFGPATNQIVGGGTGQTVSSAGDTRNSNNIGSNSPMNIMQPYQTAYMWVRTA